MDELVMAIINFLMDISIRYPLITTILAILYGAGLLFEALSAAVEKYVTETPNTDDDSWWARLKETRGYKFAKILFAFFLRIKLR